MIDSIFEPSSYFDAIVSEESGQWTFVMHEQKESLQKNQTWELAKPPKTKWIVKSNLGTPRVEETRYKTWFVAEGYG